MATRIMMFLMMNAAIMFSIYILMFVLSMFGIDVMSMAHTNSNIYLLIYASIFGFSGAFISLFLSKFLVKRTMKITMIDENEHSVKLKEIYEYIKELSKEANIRMPEVGWYKGEVNAFATGYSKNSSLIAVSSELVANLDMKEIKGVLAHEMAHITNGDMVTMTLLQGLLNTFVIFLARIIGGIVDKAILKNEDRGSGIGYYITVFILEILLSIIASMLMAWFSRYREYRADEGAIRYNGKEGIYNALEKLGGLNTKPLPGNMKAFGIVEFIGLFRSHPPIEKRLENIKNYKI